MARRTQNRPRVEPRILGHDLPNGPEQATESGEPKETGRSQGQIIDAFGLAEGKDGRDRDTELDLESGRHDSTGR